MKLILQIDIIDISQEISYIQHQDLKLEIVESSRDKFDEILSKFPRLIYHICSLRRLALSTLVTIAHCGGALMMVGFPSH